MSEEQISENKAAEYPSAEIVHNACYEDYRRVLDTYDKIYDKVNIALAFSGIVILVILSSFDYTVIGRIADKPSNLELFSLLVFLICSFVSGALIIWAVIQLLTLMRSNSITVFDSMSARNEELYNESKDTVYMWLIEKYTQATSDIRSINTKRQKTFDSAVAKLVVALVCYAVVLVLQKGL